MTYLFQETIWYFFLETCWSGDIMNQSPDENIVTGYIWGSLAGTAGSHPYNLIKIMAESLTSTGKVDGRDQMDRLVDYYLDDSHNNYDIHKSYLVAIAQYNSKKTYSGTAKPFQGSTSRRSICASPLVRVAPIVVFFWNSPRKKIIEYAVRATKTTHRSLELLKTIEIYASHAYQMLHSHSSNKRKQLLDALYVELEDRDDKAAAILRMAVNLVIKNISIDKCYSIISKRVNDTVNQTTTKSLFLGIYGLVHGLTKIRKRISNKHHGEDWASIVSKLCPIDESEDEHSITDKVDNLVDEDNEAEDNAGDEEAEAGDEEAEAGDEEAEDGGDEEDDEAEDGGDEEDDEAEDGGGDEDDEAEDGGGDEDDEVEAGGGDEEDDEAEAGDDNSLYSEFNEDDVDLTADIISRRRKPSSKASNNHSKSRKSHKPDRQTRKQSASRRANASKRSLFKH